MSDLRAQLDNERLSQVRRRFRDLPQDMQKSLLVELAGEIVDRPIRTRPTFRAAVKIAGFTFKHVVLAETEEDAIRQVKHHYKSPDSLITIEQVSPSRSGTVP